MCRVVRTHLCSSSLLLCVCVYILERKSTETRLHIINSSSCVCFAAAPYIFRVQQQCSVSIKKTPKTHQALSFSLARACFIRALGAASLRTPKRIPGDDGGARWRTPAYCIITTHIRTRTHARTRTGCHHHHHHHRPTTSVRDRGTRCKLLCGADSLIFVRARIPPTRNQKKKKQTNTADRNNKRTHTLAYSICTPCCTSSFG